MIGRAARLGRRDRRPLAPTGAMAARSAPIRLDGQTKAMLEFARNRLVVSAALFCLAFLVLGGRVMELALFPDGLETRIAWRDRAPPPAGAEVGQNRVPPSHFGRADITDRNGVVLATSLAAASLYADTRKVPDPVRAASDLATLLPGVREAVLERRLTSGRRFIWLRRKLTPNQQYRVNRLGIPGLEFRQEERRVYPQGRLAGHVVGLTDADGRGIAGIEKFFDRSLARGVARPVALSLDVRVQHALREELLAGLARTRASGAAGLVLDVLNGEVMALVSLPDFDPNDVAASPERNRFNRVTLGAYEMGSTFKTFTAAMALDARVVSMTSGYDATKPIRISRFVIRDYHAKRRWLSVPEIFMYSSNIGAAKMALDVGPEAQRRFLGRLGLLTRAEIEVPESAPPLLPARWHQTETMTIGFGHGLAVTPLQLASGVAALVNGGLRVAPTLIRREAGRPVVTQRVIRRHTSAQIRRLLRLVVERTSGRQANAPGYLVGGKTGTAEKSVRGGYDRNALLSSFVAAFPITAPRFVVLVLLDEPKPGADGLRPTAGRTAAPVVGRLVPRIAPLLGVAPVDEDDAEIVEALTVKIVARERKVASF